MFKRVTRKQKEKTLLAVIDAEIYRLNKNEIVNEEMKMDTKTAMSIIETFLDDVESGRACVEDYKDELSKIVNLLCKLNHATKKDTSFNVTLEEFKDLSDEEQQDVSDDGNGKDCANYIRVTHNGKTVLLESDAIEPEDKTFFRSLSWITKWLKKAYELGKEDAR